MIPAVNYLTIPPRVRRRIDKRELEDVGRRQVVARPQANGRWRVGLIGYDERSQQLAAAAGWRVVVYGE